MDPNGDILDEFDDDELASSIEAGKNGPWSADDNEFMDPKVRELKQQLVEPQQTSYRDRRLEELQRRAAAQGRRARSPREKPAPDADAPRTKWGEDPKWHEPTAAAPADAFDEAPTQTMHEEPVAARQQPSAIIMYAPSVFAATLVFVAATIVHGMLDGWHMDLILRGVAAMGVTGVLWRRFQAGRARAIALAAVVYTVAFTPSERLGEAENAFAVFLGLLVVVAGSGLVGVQRDEFGARRI